MNDSRLDTGARECNYHRDSIAGLKPWRPVLEFIREARVMFDLCKLRALSDDCARPTKIDNNTNWEGWLSPV